jgi:hypothetical protein
MRIGKGNGNTYWERTCSSVTSFTINPRWTHLGLNHERHGETPAMILPMLSISKQRVELLNDLMNWKECERKRLWPNMRHYLNIFMEGLKTVTKKVSSRFPGRHSIWHPQNTRHKLHTLTIHKRRLTNTSSGPEPEEKHEHNHAANGNHTAPIQTQEK